MDVAFFKTVVNSALGERQQKHILQGITCKQYRTLKLFVHNLLSGQIEMSSAQFKNLENYKAFIRRFNRGEVTRDIIGRRYNKEIVHLIQAYLGHNASGGKGSLGSFGTMAEDEKRRGVKGRKWKRSDQRIERRDISKFDSNTEASSSETEFGFSTNEEVRSTSSSDGSESYEKEEIEEEQKD